MKAIVYSRYGTADVLQLAEVATPTPTDDEVLVKIHAVSINGADREGLIGRPLYVRIGGFFKPGNPILGSDIAGRVQAVGKNVTEFQMGDEVFGEIPGYHGGFAEYACAPEKNLLKKPASLTFEQAAAIPQGGVIAWRGICKEGNVQAGQQVLINGAGGSAGVFAVQLAKLSGAHVTAVDNTFKMDFLRALGADEVMDYTRVDFTKNGKQYDLILDVVAHRSVVALARALKPDGTYFFTGGSIGTLFQILLFGSLIKKSQNRNVHLLVVPQNRADLDALTQLIEAGKIKPVIDRQFPLEQVPEAMRYVAEGRAKGKVVITVA
ncbi:MAG: NAD(P)-dependent alcohol dehydrogenase [Chloroflexota bacterium]|nr:MAG: NAD(P)-dependent alcohol dehydrogenase [Chloroflexota bacterium]